MEIKYKFKTTPFKHQADVLKVSWDKTNWAYFLEMGTGKSKVAIDNAGILFERDLIDTLIVVAPKGVYRNWANLEIPAHLPDRIKRNVVVWKERGIEGFAIALRKPQGACNERRGTV
jgi:hypothetical protein